MKRKLYNRLGGKELLFILLFLFAVFSSFLIFNVAKKYNFDNSLNLLAVQFLDKHISLAPTKDLPLGDISFFGGKFYLYFGPLPSVFLMPFVFIFGKNTPQIIIGIISMMTSFAATYFISKSLKFGKLDALYLALFFVFSTVIFSLSLINISAYQVQAMGAPFVLLSLYEYFSKKRPILIGLFLGLALLTRFVLFLSVIFFILEFLQKRLSRDQLILLFVPVFAALFLLGGYNLIRFHSFFETGYKYATAYNTYPQSLNLKYGYFSLLHIPTNLYSFLVKPPDPLLDDPKGFVLKFPYLKANPWGMAIWFTSPLFLMLLFYFKKNKYTISALITAVILAIPVLMYYSIGFAQYGYRYSLDFLPFLFLLLIPALSPKLSKKAIFLIAIGVIFNCIYITSLWGVYPVFGIY